MGQREENIFNDVFEKLDKGERREFKELTSIEISELSPGDPYVFLTPFESQDLLTDSGRLTYVQFSWKEIPLPNVRWREEARYPNTIFYVSGLAEQIVIYG